MKVEFKKEYEWSLLPAKISVQSSVFDNSELYENNFRWLRQYRKKELCFSWRAGNELGWYIRSPIDVTLYPIEDTELSLDQKEFENINKVLGFKSLWKRENSFISVSNDWMKLYQFKSGSESWETMFIPNGEGSIEWRLGFTSIIPDDYSILICPLEDYSGYTVPYGILTKKYLDVMNAHGGISIAITPHSKVKLSRGDPIARVILISNQSVKAEHEYK